MNKKVSSESVVKDIRRRTRRKYSSEEKIRIVLEGLRGEESIANLCRREGIPDIYITAGAKISWRQVRNGSWEIQPERPVLVKPPILKRKTSI